MKDDINFQVIIKPNTNDTNKTSVAIQFHGQIEVEKDKEITFTENCLEFEKWRGTLYSKLIPVIEREVSEMCLRPFRNLHLMDL